AGPGVGAPTRSLRSVPRPCIAAPQALLQTATEDGLSLEAAWRASWTTLGALTVAFKPPLAAARTLPPRKNPAPPGRGWLAPPMVRPHPAARAGICTPDRHGILVTSLQETAVLGERTRTWARIYRLRVPT